MTGFCGLEPSGRRGISRDPPFGKVRVAHKVKLRQAPILSGPEGYRGSLLGGDAFRAARVGMGLHKEAERLGPVNSKIEVEPGFIARGRPLLIILHRVHHPWVAEPKQEVSAGQGHSGILQ